MPKPEPNPNLRLDEEPHLGELVDDPVTRAVMARDGVTRAELLEHIAAAQARLFALEA
jgi:hypothetical protein